MAEVDNSPKLSKIVSEAPKDILRKRSLELKKSDKDIYVNNKTPFKRQLCKCEKLFDKGASELIIHGLGAAVYKASKLALQLKEIHHGTLDLDIKTSTVTLVDYLKALSDETDDEVINRRNSAIHIRVFRKVPLAVLRFKEKQTHNDSVKQCS